MQKILLTIAYDGTAYAGWQRQDNAVAVQEKIEDALTSLIGRPVAVKAASRTDAGVHALGQRAAFCADDLLLPIGKLPQVLSSHLPGDISVTEAVYVPAEFDPQFDAVSKTYIFQFHNAPCPNPLLRRYSAFIPNQLDIDAMKEAASYFVGRHDFKGFSATGSSAKTTVREIFDCKVDGPLESGLITMTVRGGGFLYNMVRIIAGTILYTGLGQISPGDISGIIASKDRRLAGKTMPPEGLILVRVMYKE